jgi:hypothetical protein
LMRLLEESYAGLCAVPAPVRSAGSDEV